MEPVVPGIISEGIKRTEINENRKIGEGLGPNPFSLVNSRVIIMPEGFLQFLKSPFLGSDGPGILKAIKNIEKRAERAESYL